MDQVNLLSPRSMMNMTMLTAVKVLSAIHDPSQLQTYIYSWKKNRKQWYVSPVTPLHLRNGTLIQHE